MTSSSPNINFLKDELDSRLKQAMDFVSLIGTQLHEQDLTPEDKRIIVAGYLKLVTPKVITPIESDVDVEYMKGKLVEDIISSTSKILIASLPKRHCEVPIAKTNEDLLSLLMVHWVKKGFTIEKRLVVAIDKDCEKKTYYDVVRNGKEEVTCFFLNFSW